MASKKIVLKSSDGETFEIEEAVARKFQIVAHLIEDDCADKAIPITNVTGNILAKAIEFSKKHVEADNSEEKEEEAKKKELETWEAEFVKAIDLETILKLVLAANYLNFKSFLDLLCQTVADYIKDKPVHEVRAIFNIENDFTPEEEEEIRKENQWAFE